MQGKFPPHSRIQPPLHQDAKPIIVFEGIMALYDPRIVKELELKIFVNADDDIWLSWRIKWDVAERGRTIESVLLAYNKFVKPAYDEFIKPSINKADIIIPRGAENTIAINAVIGVIQGEI